MKHFFMLLMFALVPAAFAASIQVPGSDIWVMELEVIDGQFQPADDPRNLTRRPGYDNQPAFVTANAFLFTSMDASGQTDAWRYDLGNDNTNPLLVTPESEYSPTPAPSGALSVVRVALNGVQQLWMLPAGGDRYELLFPMLEGIGYHAWLDDNRVALFMIRDDGASSELHVADRETGDVMIMAKDIGRSMQPVPGASGSIAFVERGQDGKRWIKRLDFDARRITPLAPVLENSEDFAFLPNGELLMAQGKRIFRYTGEHWQPFAEFDFLPGSISRLAVSPGGERLAIVVAQ